MLSDDITRYVELHRALGLKFKLQSCLLRHFAAFAESRGDSYVRAETVLAWAAEAPSAAQRRDRLLVVRRFSLKMQAENERYEVPPVHAFGRYERRRRMPHIYTRDEIRRLLHAAAQLTPMDSIRPTTYVTLLGLMVSTGIRISEALTLQLDDFTSEGLAIRHTKFRKSRLVPIHPSVRSALDRYLTIRNQVGGTDGSFFVSLWGTGLSYSTVNPVFRQLLRSIGLRGCPGNPGPCLHDLRHTFAVRALESCEGGDEEVARHILALSTYLGHAHPSDTYWYLQATPKLMDNIARSGEGLFNGGPA
jgi:integrase